MEVRSAPLHRTTRGTAAATAYSWHTILLLAGRTNTEGVCLRALGGEMALAAIERGEILHPLLYSEESQELRRLL